MANKAAATEPGLDWVPKVIGLRQRQVKQSRFPERDFRSRVWVDRGGII